MVCPIMIRIWQSGFIKPMSTRNERHAITCPNARQPASAAANQFQQRTHAAPVITRDTQRQAAAQRFNEAEHYGSYDDFHDFSRRQPLTQQQKDAARQRYQSASPEQRQAVRERMQTNPKIQQRREAARERIQSASPEQRQAVREKMQTNPQNQQRREAARERIQSASPEQRQVFKEKVSSAH